MTAQACAAEEKMIHPFKSTLLTEEELAAMRYVLTEDRRPRYAMCMMCLKRRKSRN
jgi:hypothetical protein